MVKGLFGGGGSTSPASDFTPTEFKGGGLSSNLLRGNKLSVRSSGARRGIVSDLSSRFGTAAKGFGELRSQVAPGFSRLRENVQETFNKRGGDLRQSFARRRLAGSSFASEAQGRLAAEESRQLNNVFLQELESSTKLLQLETQSAVNEVQTFLTELNLQAGLASNASNLITQSMTKLNALEAQLNAQESSGFGDLLGGVAGTLLGPTGAAAGTALSKAIF